MPSQMCYVEMLVPTVFTGDKFFREIMMVKWGHRVEPNLIGLMFPPPPRNLIASAISLPLPLLFFSSSSSSCSSGSWSCSSHSCSSCPPPPPSPSLPLSLSLQISGHWTHSKRDDSHLQAKIRDRRLKSILPVHWSWTSSLQIVRNKFLFKLPCLWYIVMTAWVG